MNLNSLLTVHFQLSNFNLLLATEITQADPSVVLAGVLLSAVTIYFAAKVGGELCAALNFPSVLGELISGVIVGVSVLHLLEHRFSNQFFILQDETFNLKTTVSALTSQPNVKKF